MYFIGPVFEIGIERLSNIRLELFFIFVIISARDSGRIALRLFSQIIGSMQGIMLSTLAINAQLVNSFSVKHPRSHRPPELGTIFRFYQYDGAGSVRSDGNKIYQYNQ